MLTFLSKIFGSKSDRDIKHIQPLVSKIKEEYPKLESLTHDELRAKTVDFKQRITDFLADIDKEIADLKTEAEQEGVEMSEKTAIYDKVDKLGKDRDRKLEEVLIQLLPEAFAVVKETARRFTENSELIVTATDFDRELAASKPHIKIADDKAIWQHTWTAAGT